MKLRTILWLSGLILTAGSQSADAQLLASDGFGYTAGNNLAGQTGGTGFSAAWGAGSATVVSPSLSYLNLLSSGNSAQIANPSSQTTQTRSTTTSFGPAPINTNTSVFFSFLLDRTATGGAADRGGIQFGNNAAGGGSSKLFIGDLGTSDTIGLATDSFSTTNATSRAVGTNQTHLIVVGINFGIGNETINLWVDPTSLGGTAPAATIANNTNYNLGVDNNMFALLASGATSTYKFDELRVGTTYASVTPVPEPITVLGLASAGLGLAGLRRRFRTARA